MIVVECPRLIVRSILWRLVAALVVTLGLWVFWFEAQLPSDFVAYYAGGLALQQGHSPYDIEMLRSLGRSVAPYSYPVPLFNPPFSVGVLWILSLMPPQLCLLVITTLSILCALCTPLIVGRTASRRTGFFLSAAAITFIPVLVCIRMGQITLILTMLAFLATKALQANRPTLAGLCLSPLLIKGGPFFVVLAVLGALGVSRSPLRFSVAALWVPVLSTCLLLSTGHFDWHNYSGLIEIANQRIPFSITGILQALHFHFFGTPFQELRIIVPAIASAALLYLAWRRKVALLSTRGFLVICATSICFAPFCYLFDLVVVLPILVASLFRLIETKRGVLLGGCVFIVQYLDPLFGARGDFIIWSVLASVWTITFVVSTQITKRIYGHQMIIEARHG